MDALPCWIRTVSRRSAGPALGLALALGACTGTSTPVETPSVAVDRPRPSCEVGVERLFAVTSSPSEKPEIQETSARVFLRHCNEMQWSEEIKQCLIDVDTKAGADECEKLLTPDQRAALRSDLMEALDAIGVPE